MAGQKEGMVTSRQLLWTLGSSQWGTLEIFWNPAQSCPTWRWGSWAVYQLPVLAGWGLLLGASTCLLPSTPACPACLGPEKALQPKGTGTLSKKLSAGLRRVGAWDMRLGSYSIWCWPQIMFHPVSHDFNKPFYYGSWCVCSTSPLNLTIACCCCSVTKSCLTLCDPMDYSTPGSSVRGISRARILEWVVISSSRESFWPKDQICVSYIGKRVLTSEPPGKPQ